jgi:diguanylate cyclase (GGDEF)-like protein
MGASHQTLWLFPLMIGVAGLLPTSVALIIGMTTLCIFMWTEGLNREPQELAQTAALFATWVISLAVMRLMTHQADQLADLALSDPLTGAYNRRYMQPQATRSLADYQRYARLSSLLMVDIDHFKLINDSFGHAEGDRVLKAIVSLIDNRIRGVDMLFRLGGEEFVILLTEAGALTATKIAEELRISISKMETTVGRRVTVSIGVCDVTLAESAEDWLTKVDEAMYTAKQQGRNRVYTLQSTSTPDAKISSTLPIWR